MSANRDNGTATSVLQMSSPSRRRAIIDHSDSLLAASLLPTEFLDLLDMLVDGVRGTGKLEEERRCLLPLLFGGAGLVHDSHLDIIHDFHCCDGNAAPND
ncbi:hypothetical protein KC333_g90 [Hortaea werneckii]|nr:hypothetical protein KC333_g90 [Hortaea werneckii]